MKLALIGHGSIGSRYKDEVASNTYDIDQFYIVDPKESVLEELKRKSYKCFKSVNELKENSIEITHGIVANWGPDHINTANQLIDLGCKRLIIEKPLSNRKDELQSFKKRCIKENIFVTIHHHWPYTGILKKIKDAEVKFNLGKPQGIRILGGSVCLSTNGTHYLDLSCDVLGSIPNNIIADLELDYINPRDKSLLNIGGTAAYRMQNSTFINLSFSNNNSEAIRLEIIYRNSKIELGSDRKLRFFRRDIQEVEKFGDKITRYGVLNFESELDFDDTLTINKVLNNLINGNEPIVSIQKAEVASLMVLGAIQSHLEGKRIDYDNIKDKGLMIS